MSYSYNARMQQRHQEEMVSPKQRKILEQREAQYRTEIDDRLNQLSDSPYKEDLIRLRDHCFSKFPVFPLDLSIWLVAYYEDWQREFDRVPANFR